MGLGIGLPGPFSIHIPGAPLSPRQAAKRAEAIAKERRKIRAKEAAKQARAAERQARADQRHYERYPSLNPALPVKERLRLLDLEIQRDRQAEAERKEARAAQEMAEHLAMLERGKQRNQPASITRRPRR